MSIVVHWSRSLWCCQGGSGGTSARIGNTEHSISSVSGTYSIKWRIKSQCFFEEFDGSAFGLN